MDENRQTTVVMTAEEKAEFEAFQAANAKKAAEEKASADREQYKLGFSEWKLFFLTVGKTFH